MKKNFALGMGLMLALTACGDSSDTDTDSEDAEPTLTCDVLAADDFCWLTSVEEAYACVDTDLDGVFDETRSTCTYSDGVTVTFAEPVPEDVFADDGYEFEFDILDVDGGSCASFAESGTGATLTTASGTFTLGQSGIMGLALECPSGDAYETDNALSLFECDGALFPGFMYSGGAGSLSWSLTGSPEGTFGLINCSPAP